MSQIENTRPRTGQIVRPAQFSGQPGPSARDSGPPPVDPDYGRYQAPPYGSPGCGPGECGCGSSYCGPGQGFCWWCMKKALVAEIACLLKTDPELQAILNAPAVGVTDGSNAVPGQVGEFIGGQAVFQVPALTQGQVWSSIMGPLVVPAGDWLVTGYGYSAISYQGIDLAIAQMPPGLSTDMAASIYTGNATDAILNCVPARASVTTPTLLPFTLSVNGATGGSGAGPFTVACQAWRMR